MNALESGAARLEQAAERLRAGELDGEEAAALVERCAELAAALGAELERESRAALAEPVPGQGELL
jgi:hypothetical protein